MPFKNAHNVLAWASSTDTDVLLSPVMTKTIESFHRRAHPTFESSNFRFNPLMAVFDGIKTYQSINNGGKIASDKSTRVVSRKGCQRCPELFLSELGFHDSVGNDFETWCSADDQVGAQQHLEIGNGLFAGDAEGCAQQPHPALGCNELSAGFT